MFAVALPHAGVFEIGDVIGAALWTSDIAIRPAKTQLKISCCHRSDTGAAAWLRVRGYISTARKHGIKVMAAIRDAITGNPWKPPVAALT